MSPAPVTPEDRSACSPCRGTGKVISGLGGTPHEVTCPWCEGTGRFQPEHDAVTAPAGERGAPPAAD